MGTRRRNSGVHQDFGGPREKKDEKAGAGSTATAETACSRPYCCGRGGSGAERTAGEGVHNFVTEGMCLFCVQ